MDESLRQREEAEAKAADVDRRLANLEKEIAALRGQGEARRRPRPSAWRSRPQPKSPRFRPTPSRKSLRAGKAARMALKRYSAELAMGLAEQKVRARMTPETEDALVQGSYGI